MNNRVLMSILAAGMVLVMISCGSDPENDPGNNLTGTVSIPKGVILGTDVTADTSALSGSGALSYVWEHGSAENGSFTALSGETGAAVTLTESPDVIESGRYIRVIVTREGRQGSQTSNAARIFDAVTITDVSISIAGGVPEVEPGGTYQLSAEVTHSNTEYPDFFQEVHWSVTPADPDSASVTSNGTLTVENAITADELTLTAVSIFDASRSDTLTLDVYYDLGFRQVIPTVFDVMADDQGFQNADFEDPRFGTVTMPDGIEAYFIEHAKTRMQTNGTYEVRFRVDPPRTINFPAGGYNRLSVDMAADNLNLTNEINSFFLRLRNTNEDWYQSNCTTEFISSVRSKLGEVDDKEFVTMELPLPGVFHSGTTSYTSLTDVTYIWLRFIPGSATDIPGRIYFRNLRLYNVEE